MTIGYGIQESKSDRNHASQHARYRAELNTIHSRRIRI